MCFAICLLSLYPSQLIAQPSNIEQHKVLTKDDILVKIDFYAKKYNVSSDTMIRIISCETSGTFDTNIQSKVRYKFNDPRRNIVMGDQERSFGLSQIHLPDHPNVTYEQAIDADFALEFMADKLSKGQARIWYCYKG